MYLGSCRPILWSFCTPSFSFSRISTNLVEFFELLYLNWLNIRCRLFHFSLFTIWITSVAILSCCSQSAIFVSTDFSDCSLLTLSICPAYDVRKPSWAAASTDTNKAGWPKCLGLVRINLLSHTFYLKSGGTVCKHEIWLSLTSIKFHMDLVSRAQTWIFWQR